MSHSSILLDIHQRLEAVSLQPEGDTSIARTPRFSVPFDRDPDFVDRPDIMAWMKEQYAGSASRLALVGMRGFGKSQVIIQFAHHIHDTSPQTSLFWVHASSKPRLNKAYRSIAERLSLPRRNDPNIDVLGLICDWLQTEEAGSWLMVLDNADDVNLFYLSTNAGGNKAANQPVDENGVARSDQRPLAAYLPKRRSRTILVTSRSIDAAEKLTAYINYRAPRISIRTYLDTFRKSNKKKGSLLISDAGDLRRDETVSNSVVMIWQVPFEQTRRERPSAANLIAFISFFNPQSIPEFMLYNYNTDLTDIVDNDAESDEFEDNLDVLRGYLLISVIATGDICEMHALVHFCMRAWMSVVDDVERWGWIFLRTMSRHFPSGVFETCPVCQMLLPHIESVLEGEPPNEDLKNWACLLTNCAWYMLAIGNYRAAEHLSGKAVETRTKVLGKEHPDTLTSMHNLAATYRNQGRWKEAEELEVRVMETSLRVLGEEHGVRYTVHVLHGSNSEALCGRRSRCPQAGCAGTDLSNDPERSWLGASALHET
ncbi:hypothetical protein H9L39_15727 [Fusarium oxysporum f. sp. albedinis]|nr:hypothetical protein H9L39_15727 [Fusarium oxysporum f. sp. albedinis]